MVLGERSLENLGTLWRVLDRVTGGIIAMDVYECEHRLFISFSKRAERQRGRGAKKRTRQCCKKVECSHRLAKPDLA